METVVIAEADATTHLLANHVTPLAVTRQVAVAMHLDVTFIAVDATLSVAGIQAECAMPLVARTKLANPQENVISISLF